MTAGDSVLAYGRLSREDEKDKTTPIEVKVRNRKAILHQLARQEKVELEENQIIFDLKSGDNLDERSGLLEVLERCARREVHTLLLQDIDRITRDMEDWLRIKRALYKGQIRLITARGIYHFTPQFDSTLLDILAVMGERELRAYRFRSKLANDARARAGQLSAGYPPYGYRWDKERRCFFLHPEEYPLLEEMFRRIWQEGSYTIAADLNSRRLPPPSKHKPREGRIAHEWLPGTVRAILANPFYTGRFCKRHETDRDGITFDLPRAQWIWSDAELMTQNEAGQPVPLPHPISLDQWEEIQELCARRQTGTPTKGLLTGLLFCAYGSPMRQGGAEFYSCGCRQKGKPHRGWCIQRPVIEALVWRLVDEIASARPPKRRAPRRNAVTDLEQLRLERSSAARSIRDKEATMEELIRRVSFYHQLPGYGPERHAETLTVLGTELEALRRRVGELSARMEQPEVRQSSGEMENLARVGVEGFRQNAPVTVQRALLGLIIKRIALEPIPEGRGMTPGAAFSLYCFFDGMETERTLPIIHPLTGRKLPKKPKREP